MNGTAITQTFYMIVKTAGSTPPLVDIPAAGTKDCCQDFFLNVLADTGNADDLRNDKSGFIYSFDDSVSSVTLTLQKLIAGVFQDVAPLNDNTYGTFFAYGFFVNNAGEKFIQYQLLWRNVLQGLGPGRYKVKCSFDFPFAPSDDQFSFDYCLAVYTPTRANQSIRLEYYLNGIFGNTSDDERRNDYGDLNFYNSYRLPGFFGYPTSKYDQEFIQYNNGQRVWVKDEQEPEFTLKLRMIPGFMHDILRTEFMQADNLLITDYNSKNPLSYIGKKVIKNSDYAPNWNILQSKLADVELKFKQEFNNLKKLYC